MQPNRATYFIFIIGLNLSFRSRFYLIANCRSEVNPSTAGQYALLRAYQNAQATLLKDADIMIVGVSHCPARSVSSRFFAIWSVDSPHVSIRPFAPRIVFYYLT